jgi:hypothetical protein
MQGLDAFRDCFRLSDSTIRAAKRDSIRCLARPFLGRLSHDMTVNGLSPTARRCESAAMIRPGAIRGADMSLRSWRIFEYAPSSVALAGSWQ